MALLLVGIVAGAALVYAADRVTNKAGLWGLRIVGFYVAWASLANLIGIGLQRTFGDDTDAFSAELGIQVATRYGGWVAAVIVALVFFFYRREQAEERDADA
jgi:hypothetical protein